MKTQATTHNTKPNFIRVFSGLIVIALMGFAAIGAAQEDTWTKKADMPTPRYSFSTSVVNGKIYAIGGVTTDPDSIFANPPEIAVATVEEYNPATDTWTKKVDMPTPRYILSTSVVNGKIYAIGGAD